MPSASVRIVTSAKPGVRARFRTAWRTSRSRESIWGLDGAAGSKVDDHEPPRRHEGTKARRHEGTKKGRGTYPKATISSAAAISVVTIRVHPIGRRRFADRTAGPATQPTHH